MKKIFALVLALVMALSLTTVAWGASTITVGASGDKATLAEAIDVAQDGDTIQLLENVDLGTSGVTVSKKITLDLGAFTITSAVDNGYGAVYVGKNGNLTINATTGGVTNTASPYGIAVGNYGVVVINGGTFDAGYALYNFYYAATPPIFGTATINGGTFVAGSSEPAIANCGKLTVAGGDIETLDSSAELNVTGGSIEELAVTEPDYAPPVTSTTISDGTVDAIDVDAAVEDSVAISGGTFAEDVSEYVADGSALVQDTSGNWVAGTAVTMGDKFDLYLADAGMNAALKAKTPDVAGLSFTEKAAKTNKDGSGNVAYIAANNGQYFVKTSAPTVADYAVTDAGKTTVLYYVTVAGTDAANFAYEASVTAFNKFSTYDKCGYVTGAPAANAVYFQTAAGDVYLAGAAGTGINYLLNGKVVSAAAAQTVVDHVFVANGYKYDSVKKVNVPTSALCTKCLTTSTAIYLDGKAPAQSTVKELTTDTAYCVVVGAVSSAPVVGGTTSSTVQSAQTFDAGIAMYVGMSVMAACGSAVVIGKKKD